MQKANVDHDERERERDMERKKKNRRDRTSTLKAVNGVLNTNMQMRWKRCFTVRLRIRVVIR